MADSADRPGCLHHVHVTISRGDSDPSHVCSCAAGLIHMHDCPVLLGLECVHFRASEEPEQVLDNRAFEKLHSELMQDFLSRAYVHRVRSLGPVPDEWETRRDDLLRRYAEEWEDEGPDEITPEAEERYVAERDRLIERRRKYEEERKEREAKTREERARERAKMGIKTVVEKARESVAARGNVSESIVDDLKLPDSDSGGGKSGGGESGGRPKRRRRRRRRSGSGEGPGPQGGQAPPQSGQPAGDSGKAGSGAPGSGGEGGAKPKRRRRRRRRKPSGDKPSNPSA